MMKNMSKCQPDSKTSCVLARFTQFFAALLILVPFPHILQAQKINSIKPERYFSVELPAPRSITFDTRLKRFYLTGDRGRVYCYNQQWGLIRNSEREGSDYQAICIHDKVLYVRDAGAQKIIAYDGGTLLPQYSFELPPTVRSTPSGSGLTWNPVRNCFVATSIAQVNRAILAEFNADFRQIQEHRLSITSLSDLSWFDGALWGYAAEGRILYRLHPETYSVTGSWRVKAKNLRSFCFDKEGNLLMLRGDKPLVYEFRLPRAPVK